jgi:hypothetical protein
MKQLITQRMLGINEDHHLKIWYDPEAGDAGKYWVSVKKPTGQSIVREKVFDGETAWSDAERFANDLVMKYDGDYTQAISL